MTPVGKRIAAGALIAVGGAFVWALIEFTSQSSRQSFEFFGILMLAGYALLITSWFILPLGAIFGVIMPRVIRDCSAPIASQFSFSDFANTIG